MENELYFISKRIKICEEVKATDYPESVTINGKEVKVGNGYKCVLRMYLHDKSVAQVSFFYSLKTREAELKELKDRYIITLCSVFLDPLSIIVKHIKSNAVL